MNTSLKTSRPITAEYLGEVIGVPSLYDSNASKHRYTIKHRYDVDDETIIVEATNEKNTVGARLYYYYVKYVGELEDMKKESRGLTEDVQNSIERIEKYSMDSQLWVLSNRIDKIMAHQAKASEYLDKCYLYVEILTGQVK